MPILNYLSAAVTEATDITPNNQAHAGLSPLRANAVHRTLERLKHVVVPVSLMWYGYAFEAIYIVLGTALFATVLGILIYH